SIHGRKSTACTFSALHTAVAVRTCEWPCGKLITTSCPSRDSSIITDTPNASNPGLRLSTSPPAEPLGYPSSSYIQTRRLSESIVLLTSALNALHCSSSLRYPL